ncbi:2632_t:CDS:2 [Diversispora eburnea]|uniref:DNA replication complex GINS protein SLD5 n=1 Tax=Diversispora eburnea TaxID=1213867 RepID=A0A9N8WBG5_9GLOM|nr:2632_t:CDS:2 [Diversispora eburnea]
MSRVFFRHDENPTTGLEDEALQFTKEFFDDDDLDIDLVDDDDSIIETDVEKLKRAWLNENYSPEILPYEPALERLNSLVEDQATKAESLILSSMDTCSIAMLLFNDNEQNTELKNRLSSSELEFAENYIKLIEKHKDSSFLHKFSQNSVNILKTMNYDLEQAIFCKLKEDFGTYSFPSSLDEEEQLKKGDSYLIKYNDIRRLLNDGYIDLI